MLETDAPRDEVGRAGERAVLVRPDRRGASRRRYSSNIIALRDESGRYLGCVETLQNVAPFRCPRGGEEDARWLDVFPAQSIKLAASVVLCMLAGFIGSIFTTPKIAGLVRGAREALVHAAELALRSRVDGRSTCSWGSRSISSGGGASPRRGSRSRSSSFSCSSFSTRSGRSRSSARESPLAGLVVIVALWVMIVATIAALRAGFESGRASPRALHSLGELRGDSQRVDLSSQPLGRPRIGGRSMRSLSPGPRSS